jgi:MFS family permease
MGGIVMTRLIITSALGMLWPTMEAENQSCRREVGPMFVHKTCGAWHTKSAWISARIGRLRHQTFRALHTRNYRLYFTAQMTSRTGMWVQIIAENWLVVQLGGSGLLLGIITALPFVPLLLLSTYGGVLVDRWNKRTVLIVTQSASGTLALMMGLLALTGVIQLWMIWMAAFLLGCINALDMPAREAFTMELASPANVTNAVALNDVVRNAARAFGPALGGLLIASIGIVACFLMNAASYAVIIAALRRMNPAELYTEVAAPRRRGQIWEGLRYVWTHPALRTVLLIMSLATTFGFNFQMMITLYASQTFHQGAAFYGLLMSCLGIGAVVGSLMAASWNDPTLRRVAVLSLTFGVTQWVAALVPNLALGFLAMSVMGMASSLFLTSCASCLQLHAGEQMRGRVMALYSIAFLGTAPIGGPLLGWLAQSLGVRAGFFVAGLGCIAASGLVFLSGRQTGALDQKS